VGESVDKNGGVTTDAMAKQFAKFGDVMFEFLHTPEGMELMRQVENKVEENKKKAWWKFWKK
jgi:hypothetical protein